MTATASHHWTLRRLAGTGRGLRRWLALGFVALHAVPAAAQTTPELKRMSLEALMEVDVSTVSRTPEPAKGVPAAVFIITQDDIRRSGATSLPEALRLAPGMQIARINASTYAIGMRGFADRLSRAMLVLIDGRAVYSPLFAGTYWEVQDVLLGDVDHIEVIRGPGGTLWGANAVNGIVNIITKSAADTQGTLVSTAASSTAIGPLAVRYGGQAGDNLHYRVYAQATDRQPQFHQDGVNYDQFRLGQGGARADWKLAGSRALTLQGDVYGASLGQRFTLTSLSAPFSVTSTRDAALSGGNALMRWSGPGFGGSRIQWQTYYDRTKRDELPVGETRDTLDADFQSDRTFGTRHDLVWGAGARVTTSRITAVAPSAITPVRRTDTLFTAFAQDDVSLVPKRLRAIIGAKIEHNDYSGVEVQPSGRLVLEPNPSHTLVFSITRAVRTPSRVETDYTTASLVTPAIPAFVRLLPNPGFQAEELIAYELGYRVQPVKAAYVTVSGFYNHLAHILSTELLTPFAEADPAPAHLVFPVMFANGIHGESHGIELTGDIRPTPWWRWTANYSFLRVYVRKNPGGNDVSQVATYEGRVPHHQALVQSSIDLPKRVQMDWIFGYTSALAQGPVPAHGTVTARLAWEVRRGIELAFVAADLNSAHHLEWTTGAPGTNAEASRRIGVTFTWRR